jgi:hypothetical protein
MNYAVPEGVAGLLGLTLCQLDSANRLAQVVRKARISSTLDSQLEEFF